MLMGGTGELLLASAVGYWVMERADRHKGQLKTLGQVLGAIIIVLSLVGIAGRVWGAVKCAPDGWCPVSGMKGMCPLSAPKSSP